MPLGAVPSSLQQKIKMPRGRLSMEMLIGSFFEVKDDNAGLNLTGFQFVNAIERVPLSFYPMQIITWLI